MEVLDLLGLETGTDRTRQLRCPIHEDRHPSARLYDDNRLYCFTCQRPYDALDLVQHVRGLGFQDAVIWLEQAFDLGPTAAGAGLLVQDRLRQTRPADPAPLLALLEQGLRQTRPQVSMATYAKWATAIDVLTYQVQQGLLSVPALQTHATQLLGHFHAL